MFKVSNGFSSLRASRNNRTYILTHSTSPLAIRKTARSVLLLGLIVQSASFAHAADYTWTGATDQNLNGKNYSPYWPFGGTGNLVDGDKLLFHWVQGNMQNTPLVSTALKMPIAPRSTVEIQIGAQAEYGELNINNGGTLDVSGANMYIGNDAGSNGVVTIDGNGSGLTITQDARAAYLYVGKAGNGTLNIKSGGNLTGGFVLGDSAGSIGTINIEDVGTEFNSLYAVIGNSGAGTLSLSKGAAPINPIRSLTVAAMKNSNGTLEIDGKDTSLTINSLTFGDGNAAVNVTDGGKLIISKTAPSVGTILADAKTAITTMTVDGEDSNLDLSNTIAGTGNAHFTIGNYGTATVSATNGGKILNVGKVDIGTNGQGTLIVDGLGSEFSRAIGQDSAEINVGSSLRSGTDPYGHGIININNGGSIILTNLSVYNGSATVNGKNSLLDSTAGWLVLSAPIDGAADANFSITAGAATKSLVVSIADSAARHGTAIVDGADSTWEINHRFYVGRDGDGQVAVTNGGVINGTDVYIGNAAGANGTVIISGNKSGWSINPSTVVPGWALNGNLVVGWAGNGTLTLSDKAFLHVANNIIIGRNAGATGVLNIGAPEGATAAASGELTAMKISFAAGTGTLNLNYLEADYTLTSALSGSGTINQMTGITTLTGDGSAFTGMTNVKAGTLQIGDGGTTGSLNGSIINDTHVIFNRSDALEYTGSLGGAGDLRKLGAGMLTMSGDSSTFAGTTGVEGGSLFVSGTLGNANSGAVTVAAGSSLAGTGTIGGITTIANGAALIGNQGSVLTFRDSLILSGTSIVDASLGQAPNAAGLFNVQGNLTLNGVLNITDQGDFGPGLYRLFDYGGTLSGNGLTLGTVPQGADTSAMQFQNPANQYNLYVAGAVANNIWAGGDGIWNTTNTNWTDINGSQTGIWNQGDYAQFGTVGHQVTVDDSAGGLIVQGLVFSTDGYMLKGDYFTLEGSKNPTIRVGDGSAAGAGMTATIASELRGNQGLTKIDYGTLVLTGSNSYTGGTTVNQGILQLGDGGNSGSIAGDVVLNRDQYGHGTLAFDRVDTNTFAGKISGGGDVVQRGTGTTVFAGDNTFTGGLTVENGTAKAGIAEHAFGSGLLTVGKTGTVDLDSFNEAVAGLAGSGHVALGSGILTLDQNIDTSFSGTMDGTGSLTKNGSGKLTLSGTSTYSGPTQVNGGALIQAAAGSFSSASTYAVAQEGQIELGGYTTGMASLSNAGTINFGGAGGTVLDVAGNYAGNSGTLVLNTVLGDDSSKTDFMKVGGDSSGTSIVKVINRGGIGAQTNEGIRLIEVVGQSNGMFNLAGDYTTKSGESAVVAGAYAYTLHEGGVNTPADGDWYLRSALKDGKGPVINPGIPLYQGAVQSMQVLNKLPTLRQRVGNRFWGGATNPVIEQDAGTIATPLVSSGEAGAVVGGRAVWGRIEGAHNRFEANRSTSGMKQDINSFILQTGVDGQFYEGEAGLLIGGITGQYGKAHSDIASKQSDGKIDTQSWGLGATLTWYGDNGFYADGQVQTNWYDNDYNSTTAKRNPTNGRKGFGYALSAEAGQRIDLNDRWSLTPQAQLMWSSVDFDSFNDVWGTAVALRDGDSLTGRIGISADYRNVWRDADGQLVRSSIYGIANLYQELMGDMSIKVAEVNFGTGNDRTWGGIGAGGTYSWNDDTYALYGEGSLNTSLNNFADSYTIKGTAGFRIRW